jgi:hypothetical protein
MAEKKVIFGIFFKETGPAPCSDVTDERTDLGGVRYPIRAVAKDSPSPIIWCLGVKQATVVAWRGRRRESQEGVAVYVSHLDRLFPPVSLAVLDDAERIYSSIEYRVVERKLWHLGKFLPGCPRGYQFCAARA